MIIKSSDSFFLPVTALDPIFPTLGAQNTEGGYKTSNELRSCLANNHLKCHHWAIQIKFDSIWFDLIWFDLKPTLFGGHHLDSQWLNDDGTKHVVTGQKCKRPKKTTKSDNVLAKAHTNSTLILSPISIYITRNEEHVDGRSEIKGKLREDSRLSHSSLSNQSHFRCSHPHLSAFSILAVLELGALELLVYRSIAAASL